MIEVHPAAGAVFLIGFLVLLFGLITYSRAGASRQADREFGDWPDQVADRARRMPDDPGEGAE
ncbi:MAG: hypothetical protein ABJO97_22710 [Roseibium sp.]|uniref:hypothetical protein n=1 Tax=Roseibium TaxID=150830 RepID=UPI0032663006